MSNLEQEKSLSDIMLPCPFCGGEAKKTFIGNNHTKSRKIEVKCTKCFTKQVTATMRYGFDKCDEWANEKWNSRATGEELTIKHN